MVLRVFSLRIERYPSIVSFRGPDEVALTVRVALAPAASAKLAEKVAERPCSCRDQCPASRLGDLVHELGLLQPGVEEDGQ